MRENYDKLLASETKRLLNEAEEERIIQQAEEEKRIAAEAEKRAQEEADRKAKDEDSRKINENLAAVAAGISRKKDEAAKMIADKAEEVRSRIPKVFKKSKLGRRFGKLFKRRG